MEFRPPPPGIDMNRYMQERHDCVHFNQAHGCAFGSSCHYRHIVNQRGSRCMAAMGLTWPAGTHQPTKWDEWYSASVRDK